MPYGFGTSGAFTTGDIGAGRQFTRLRGPVLIGAQGPSALGDFTTGKVAILNPPSIYNISTAPADMSLTAEQYLSTASTIGFVYIPITTGSLSSGTAPTMINKNAAMAFDANLKILWIYTTDNGWRGIGATSSGGNLWVTSSGP